MAKVKAPSWKSFEKWLEQEVTKEFGLTRHFGFKPLDDFLSNLPSLAPEEKAELVKLNQKLKLYVDAWREEDLKMEFISGVLNIPAFQHPQRIYRTFFDYPLKANLKNQSINGKVDCMLAQGFQIAEKPIFFLQEYKPQTRPTGDPLGQLLIAMVAAQYINNDQENPLYGCYIIGQMWFFVVCHGTDFSVSSAFNSTDLNSLEAITAVLKKVKTLYEAKLQLKQA